MARFAYFVPAAMTAPAAIRVAGLGYAFDGIQPASRGVGSGPGGARGILLAADAPGCELAYLPDGGQEWCELRSGNGWIGIDLAAIPGPDDLARPVQIGRTWRLGDGHYWTIPTAILANGESPLPKSRTIAQDGTIRRRVKAAYEPLYLAADEVADSIRHGVNLTDQRQIEIAVAALAINYRVGIDEVASLAGHADLFADMPVESAFLDPIAIILFALTDRLNWPDVPPTEENE